ncbi:MAG TPA: hypothetical protein VJ835_08570 [Fimbriimonadaceae bacterium]|nr:hypothetical protein [Fimbriimonadaceae bacterium]
MRIAAIVVALLAGLIIWAQTGTSPQRAKSAFELLASSELKQGAIRPYAETQYRYFQVMGDGSKRELWSVLLNEKYLAHWISPSGMVWVQTEFIPGPGGGGHIWARDRFGDVKGVFPAYAGLPSRRIGGSPGDVLPFRLSQPEVKVVNTAHYLTSGAEQLQIKQPGGEEVRITIVPTPDGDVSVLKRLQAGQPDLFTDLLNKPQSSPQVEFRRIEGMPFGLWQVSVEGRTHWIRQVLAESYQGRTLEVKREDEIADQPTRVVATPSGKILWFEFTNFQNPGIAQLEIFTLTGEKLDTVDLMKLGKFPSPREAKQQIIYGDVLWNGGSGLKPVDSPERYGSADLESYFFNDRTGRKYQIDLKKEGETYLVDAKASLNIKQPANVVEPKFPGAAMINNQVASSPDGKFTATAKTYKRDGNVLTQLTLTSHIVDPVVGGKSIQLFSVPVATKVEGLKVSDSGRVFGVSFISQQPIGDKKVDMCLFQAWEPTGRNMNFDLIRLKWFSTLAEAKAQLNMKAFKAQPEGVRGEREFNGVPIPVYPLETLTFPFRSGKIENLYIGYVNDQMPNIFYTRRPKSLPGVQ